MYWRSNLTLRRLVPLFEASKPVADRAVDRLGLRWCKRSRKGAVLIVGGILMPAVTTTSPKFCFQFSRCA